VRDNLQILLQTYFQPARAFSAVLDHGSFVFAGAAAALVSLPLDALPFLLAAAILFVPACIALIAAWDGLGSTGVALRRDYAPMAVCILMSWTASGIPVAAAVLVTRQVAPQMGDIVLQWAAGLGGACFLALSVMAVRTVSGTSTAHAAGTVLAAAAITGAGAAAYTVFGRFLSFFASPFVLFWLYYLLRPDFSSFTGGLRSRQNFRRALEASTVNPRDSDAHYQLGLIYQQRRNYAEAIARFQKAVEIDPNEPDAHYQLGRIAREQGRHEDALRSFTACAKLDDKHCSSEVWRDLGASNFELGNTDLALAQLEKYVNRREYDAEGLYWLGQTYKRLGRGFDAREVFERAVEAARTAAPHRRQQAARWGRLAQSELGKK
jgi:Tfp pilus assembly protein PilF